jgi:hypothetical protein
VCVCVCVCVRACVSGVRACVRVCVWLMFQLLSARLTKRENCGLNKTEKIWILDVFLASHDTSLLVGAVGGQQRSRSPQAITLLSS